MVGTVGVMKMKRFNDTDIWKRPWFRRLSPAEKCAFQFIRDNCDNAGVWIPDYEAAEFNIGESLDWDTLPEKVNENIRVLENGKWWIPDFCEFQFGELHEGTSNKAHKSHIALLKKHNLWPLHGDHRDSLGVQKGPLYEAQEKETVKAKEKATAKEQEPTEIWENEIVEKATWQAFEKGYGSFLPNRDKELDAINQLLHKAKARGDPGVIIPKMMEKFLELKKTDNSKKGFWKYQPFLPSALAALWDRVWEVVKVDFEEQEEAEDIPF